jgi:hypothetical protein
VWTAARSSRGLVTFNKRFYWEIPEKKNRNGAPRRKKHSALVDIVAEEGAEWIKVSTITENRLLFEKAKAGWEGADSDSEGEDESQDGGKVLANGASHEFEEPCVDDSSDDEDDKVELLKTALDLQKASRKVRIRYKHPRIRFVLPNIIEHHDPAIDAILASIRETGATIQCGTQLSSIPDTINGATSGISHPFPLEHILPDPLANLTPTLNIDCTILLALVSDLSHSAIYPTPTLHRAIRRQIALEADEKLLTSSLYPVMVGRELLCTAPAAKRMREIVQTIGTPGERIRTELLLGEGTTGEGKSAAKLRAAFAEQSIYPVPDDWRLPIKVQEGKYDLENLPTVAKKLEDALTEINRSVFLWGWERGIVTVSSNRAVAKTVEGIVDAEEGEVEGPAMWLCATARSLVGKEKGRRD